MTAGPGRRRLERRHRSVRSGDHQAVVQPVGMGEAQRGAAGRVPPRVDTGAPGVARSDWRPVLGLPPRVERRGIDRPGLDRRVHVCLLPPPAPLHRCARRCVSRRRIGGAGLCWVGAGSGGPRRAGGKTGGG